jgi:hypothetical protein
MDRSGSPPEDLFAAAREALANGRRLQAHGLLEACVESGHVGYAARAGAILADLAMARGDADGAERMARTAMERGTGEGRATAAISLVGILLARDQDAETEGLYREVMDAGTGESAPLAAFNLGVLFTLTGDSDQAITALRTAIATAIRRPLPVRTRPGAVAPRPGEPGRGPQAAAQIIEDLEAWEGHLAPRPAEALAWARTI